MKKWLRISGVTSLMLAALSWLVETLFYGDIDETGVLQESFFLPLAFILAALGIVLLVASFLTRRSR
ncbi:DUF3955 domain-containing protein [Halomonas halocynthiae]|uniref:DUF3955 domain-containing protein n=1 Tax=Halomonas halocynthiae TaxID=176290 RepID=UPI000408B08B|nr:DUF3955 domain-containing protein [Halomonas halocynthiae]